MAIKKTSQGEGKLNVLRGSDAELLNDKFAKTGKYRLSDFSEEELEEFQSEMEAQKNDAEAPKEHRGNGGDA